MNLKKLLFRQHHLVELSCSQGNKKCSSKRHNNKIVYPEDFAEAMFGIFTERDLKF